MAGVFKNSGTAGDTEVNWRKRQKGKESLKSMTAITEKQNKTEFQGNELIKKKKQVH